MFCKGGADLGGSVDTDEERRGDTVKITDNDELSDILHITHLFFINYIKTKNNTNRRHVLYFV